jgi:myo-inositol-1(or 4)-monophosphatase
LHGLPHFGVSIAQQIKGRTEHAVVFDPMREELFTASRGSGAFLNNRRIRVSARTELEGAILATAFPFRQREKLKSYARVFQAVFDQVEDFRRAGTACLDLAWVAAGRLDGFFEVGLKPWDVAAGALIVREAGGVVLDFAGGDDVENSGTLIAAPYKIMTPLRQIICNEIAVNCCAEYYEVYNHAVVNASRARSDRSNSFFRGREHMDMTTRTRNRNGPRVIRIWSPPTARSVEE